MVPPVRAIASVYLDDAYVNTMKNVLSVILILTTYCIANFINHILLNMRIRVAPFYRNPQDLQRSEAYCYCSCTSTTTTTRRYTTRCGKLPDSYVSSPDSKSHLH